MLGTYNCPLLTEIVLCEIKNDINVITCYLLDKVPNNPEILYKITQYQFEKLV